MGPVLCKGSISLGLNLLLFSAPEIRGWQWSLRKQEQSLHNTWQINVKYLRHERFKEML